MPTHPKMHLPEDRYFSSDPVQRHLAMELYAQVKDLPLLCPHGHVDPKLFADPNAHFGSPTELLIIPDHYILRMLYSQGVAMEEMGVPRRGGGYTEQDHRKVWQIFADYYYLFQGTPTGMWFNDELHHLFGVEEKLTSQSALAIYDHIDAQLKSPAFQPRALFERFNIESLSTTDPATYDLSHHKAIRESGWGGKVIPTFRPDAVVNLDTLGWRENIDALSQVSGVDIVSYPRFIEALEVQRTRFKEMGATATDHAALSPYTEELSAGEVEAIFQRALSGSPIDEGDAQQFTAHMLMQMARMSIEDGLVMQLHPGALRNHNPQIFDRFGSDMGADIPMATEFTRNLRPLLNKYGNDRRLTLILFMLDETTQGRELAPLAGHYPCLRLGPPWWFFDSWNGMMRFLENVTETAGLYNTVGFNDDTRAYPSIPARHDLARRVFANWIANLQARHIIDRQDAEEMIQAAAYGLAKKAYNL